MALPRKKKDAGICLASVKQRRGFTFVVPRTGLEHGWGYNFGVPSSVRACANRSSQSSNQSCRMQASGQCLSHVQPCARRQSDGGCRSLSTKKKM
eukprot:5545429-Amphidinium_carterae.1